MNETSGSAPLMVNHQPSRTFAEASPVVAGYFTVSFVFGLMAVNAGLPMWLPVAMCLFVYAGASQFAALALISSHPMSEERLARMSEEHRWPTAPPLLSAEEWTALKNICGNGKTGR